MSEFIPVNEPLLDGNEKKYLNECIDTGWISSEGPFVQRFEENMAAVVGRKRGIAVCNGTVALETAVAALELQPGDEVILPAFTIVSCVAAIVRRGCVPVLVDSDPITWNMDVAQIEARITPRTKAIMVVHIYGLPADMEPVLALARKHGLKIIEDAAEMHGQTYRGKPCGERCRSLRNLCFQPHKRFVHEELGYNFRMTNLQAALGLAQLERLDDFVRRKRHMGRKYTGLLSGVAGLTLPLERTDYADNIYWVYGIVLRDNVPCDAEEMMRRLGQRNIGSRPFFWPMHEQPVFRGMGLFKDERYPVAERMARRGFYLPSGLALTDDQIERVCAEVVDEIRKVM